jgi:P27 family predicted phage terminase small subunit
MGATNDKQHLSKDTLAARENKEPKCKSSKLKCPARLSDDARKEWRRLVALYREIDPPIITDLDVNALEIYCEALVTYRKAMEIVKKSGEVIKGGDGVKTNPYWRIARDSADQCRQLSAVLLLDPVSRARVGLAKSKEDELDPMAELLKRRSGG